MPLHPELVAFAADILAAADRPLSTGELSIKLTTAMRRFAQSTGTPEAEVMTLGGADSGVYYEVASKTIPAVISQARYLVPIVDVGLKCTVGRRKERHYATQANIDRWEAQAAERLQIGERVRTRKVWSDAIGAVEGNVVQVIADDRLIATFVINERTGWDRGEPVMAERLGETFAFEQAEALARKVRVSMVKAAMAA